MTAILDMPLLNPSQTNPARTHRRFHVATPALQLPDNPAALVLRVARLEGPIFRNAAAQATGLSAATVNRQVVALLGAGLLRERADLAPAGAIGRPRLPFEINRSPFLTVGIHIGFKVTAITAHDLRGRILGGIQIPTSPEPAAGVESVLESIGRSAERFLTRWTGRRALWAGVAIGGRVDPHGRVDHPRLPWTAAPVGEVLSSTLGLPVSVAPHVEAMAAAELLHVPPKNPHGSTLYYYAREMVGVSLTINGAVHTPTAGPGSIGHLPAGPTELLDPRRTGRLEDTVTDTGIIEAALAAGLAVDSVSAVHRLASDGDDTALALLRERARVLGRSIGLISDVVNPDHIILGGQAFTDFTDTLRDVARAVSETSAAPRRDLRVTAARGHVQQQAAGAVSLDAIYSDPLAALRHTED